jgi:response regulator NasT
MQSNANQSIRVLVVDDEAIVNTLVQSQLANLGYEVAGSAFDGPEAVALTHELKPDLVLMDLQMSDPETDRMNALPDSKPPDHPSAMSHTRDHFDGV